MLPNERLPFERGAQLDPQPIAVACGRICRARGAQEELDTILRGAEVLTRYVSAVTVCSVSSRPDATGAVPALEALQANLSFGKFLQAVQWAVKVECEHPLQHILQNIGTHVDWDGPLIRLLELRNEFGHDLQSISQARAVTVLKGKNPAVDLIEALRVFAPLLELPLFVLEAQELQRKKVRARRLLLMGESSDPMPEEIEIKGALSLLNAPYISINGSCLTLHPIMIWDVAPAVATYALYFIDKVEEHTVAFQTLGRDEMRRELTDLDHVAELLRGDKTVDIEECTGADDRSFATEWRIHRRTLEHRLTENAAQIPWDDLDPEMVCWFGGRLIGGKVNASEARNAIVERLLDGRDQLPAPEIREIRLLLGSRRIVKQTIRRMMLDCRSREKGKGRWGERAETQDNILVSLRLAIEFFSRHVGVAGISIDGLTLASGSADYVAMREALVNMFIHQDYGDQRTPAQIEIAPERAVFFNAGKSLVGEKALAEGGRSQPRNPLIARALRLIGFAELAGSGLRELNRAWGAAGRVPPKVESSSAANTFTLILDWHPLPQVYDEFWKTRAGVTVTQTEARILALCGSDGMTIARIAAAIELSVDDVNSMVERLVVNALLRNQRGTFILVEHLRKLLTEREQPDEIR
jgi:hypothetical protein